MMLTPIACILLISPALLIELTVPRAVFPKGADEWDRIGLFELKDGDTSRLVLLYFRDTDSIAEKAMARTGALMKSYPNFFDVHAIYQAASGKWVHQEVFRNGRVRFSKVAEVTADHVVLECRANFLIFLEPGQDVAKAMKRAEEINKPFTRRVAFSNGVLTAK
jgi:hypothetical protein